MHKRFLITSAYLGALSVALGAFGAHALKEHLSQQTLNTFETAVRYQFYHVFALALTGVLYKVYPNKKMIYAGNCFQFGILFFSGSLFSLSLLGSTNFAWIGAITPLGGIFFISAWILLALGIKSGEMQ